MSNDYSSVYTCTNCHASNIVSCSFCGFCGTSNPYYGSYLHSQYRNDRGYGISIGNYIPPTLAITNKKEEEINKLKLLL